MHSIIPNQNSIKKMNLSIANKISKRNRDRKYFYFKEKVGFTSKTKILDVGFADHEFSPIDNYLEKHYPFRANITALGVGGKDEFAKKYPDVEAVLYDGELFPFADKSFDIGWSNAVIEHVGGKDRQLLFLKELLRTCRTVYFTTPNSYFPVELHTRTLFLHWLPKAVFDNYLRRTGKSWAAGDYMYLLSKRRIADLCRQAGAQKVIIKGNRFFGFVMDYSIIMA